MQKTKIEWTDYSWNPIKGICPVGCFYCYARKIYERFWRQRNLEIRPDEEYPNITSMPLLDNKGKMISRKVFVCSTFELFHSAVKKEWRDWIFRTIKYNPHLTFQILTKFPQNIDRPMPDNVWLGVSVTKTKDLSRITRLCSVETKRRFVSFEPLLGFIQWDGFRLEFSSLDWIIVGQLTGHGKKYEPMKYWINQIKFYAGYYGIPLFMKNNLKDIWKPNKLIQEYPK